MGVIGAILLQLPGENEEILRGLWYLEPILLCVYAGALWWSLRSSGLGKHQESRRGKKSAYLCYIALAWVCAMLYEATLSIREGSIGGVHEDTLTSFIIAQGGYAVMIISALVIFTRWRYTFVDAFYFALGVGLTEALIFKPILLDTILSPLFLLAPFVLGYYTLAYSAILAFPHLVAGGKSLDNRQNRGWLVVLAGVLVGIAANLFFGLVWAPFVNDVY